VANPPVATSMCLRVIMAPPARLEHDGDACLDFNTACHASAACLAVTPFSD